MLITKKYIVSGKVQGVWFRASTKNVADRLGVKGYAKNLPDGNVEVLAIGTQDKIDALHEYLQVGPELAEVNSVFDVEAVEQNTDEFVTL